jgi:hypothetical protein
MAGRVSIVVEVKSSVTTAPEAVIVTSLTLVIITVETEIDVTVERLGHVEEWLPRRLSPISLHHQHDLQGKGEELRKSSLVVCL